MKTNFNISTFSWCGLHSSQEPQAFGSVDGNVYVYNEDHIAG